MNSFLSCSFVLQNAFIKVYICPFLINIFIKNMKSKLCFRDLIVVLNDFLYEYGGSMSISVGCIAHVYAIQVVVLYDSTKLNATWPTT
jgi:hypothetical protein